MYNKWLENVNKNTLVRFVPTEGTRICSQHFSPDMQEEGGHRVILITEAICCPNNIFYFSGLCFCQL